MPRDRDSVVEWAGTCAHAARGSRVGAELLGGAWLGVGVGLKLGLGLSLGVRVGARLELLFVAVVLIDDHFSNRNAYAELLLEDGIGAGDLVRVRVRGRGRGSLGLGLGPEDGVGAGDLVIG